MQKDWHEFLTSTPAPQVKTVEATHLTDLSRPDYGLGLISVRGADSANFLQSQLSNDVMRLGEHASQLSAWCDAKGRVLALIRLFRRDDAYYLLLPTEILETTLKRLSLFVLRAKVALADASDQLLRFSVYGPHAAAQISDLGAAAPEINAVSEIMNCSCLRLPGDTPSYIFVGEIQDCKTLWARVANLGSHADYPVWQRNRILAGQPQICAATQGQFVPQMLNLHWLSAVDFHKGCYPGQEVVARLQYRGKLKRNMVLLQLECPDTPQPGTAVTTADGTVAGEVVTAAPQADDGNTPQQILLAVVQVNTQESPYINGVALKLLALPYATPYEPV